MGREAGVSELAPEDLLADLAAGAVGLQAAVRAVLPGMRERGSGTVLVTGGGSADRPMTSMATLGVQKAALRALAEVQARALAPEGVHVATVTIRGLVGEDRQITPERVAALYAELVAETAGPRENWRSVVDLHALRTQTGRRPQLRKAPRGAAVGLRAGDEADPALIGLRDLDVRDPVDGDDDATTPLVDQGQQAVLGRAGHGCCHVRLRSRRGSWGCR